VSVLSATTSDGASESSRWHRFWPVMPPPAHERNVTTLAYHEAGHAVVFALMGLPVAGAEVWADGGGEMRFDRAAAAQRQHPPINFGETSLIWKQTAVLFASGSYAGMQAELLLHGHCIEGYLSLTDPDHQGAAALLREQFNDDHPAPIVAAQHLARGILQRHWPAVQTLAEKLRTEGCINHADVISVLPPVLPRHIELLAELPWNFMPVMLQSNQQREKVGAGGTAIND